MPIPISTNPLTQFTTYIPMLSALLGATIGGTISYLNLKRQFKEQRKRDIAQESKNERIAINSVNKEITFNNIQLINFKNKMDKFDMLYVSKEEQGVPLTLKQDKWIKHSDTIEFIEKSDGKVSSPNLEDHPLLVNLEYYYYSINLSLTEQHITLETVNTLLQIGKRISAQLERALVEYETK